jgi:hypothetical protein
VLVVLSGEVLAVPETPDDPLDDWPDIELQAAREATAANMMIHLDITFS